MSQTSLSSNFEGVTNFSFGDQSYPLTFLRVADKVKAAISGMFGSISSLSGMKLLTTVCVITILGCVSLLIYNAWFKAHPNQPNESSSPPQPPPGDSRGGSSSSSERRLATSRRRDPGGTPQPPPGDSRGGSSSSSQSSQNRSRRGCTETSSQFPGLPRRIGTSDTPRDQLEPGSSPEAIKSIAKECRLIVYVSRIEDTCNYSLAIDLSHFADSERNSELSETLNRNLTSFYNKLKEHPRHLKCSIEVLNLSHNHVDLSEFLANINPDIGRTLTEIDASATVTSMNVFRHLDQVPKLKLLKVNHCENLTSLPSAGLKRCESIEELHCCNTNCWKQHSSSLIDVLPNLKSVICSKDPQLKKHLGLRCPVYMNTIQNPQVLKCGHIQPDTSQIQRCATCRETKNGAKPIVFNLMRYQQLDNRWIVQLLDYSLEPITESEPVYYRHSCQTAFMKSTLQNLLGLEGQITDEQLKNHIKEHECPGCVAGGGATQACEVQRVYPLLVEVNDEDQDSQNQGSLQDLVAYGAEAGTVASASSSTGGGGSDYSTPRDRSSSSTGGRGPTYSQVRGRPTGGGGSIYSTAGDRASSSTGGRGRPTGGGSSTSGDRPSSMYSEAAVRPHPQGRGLPPTSGRPAGDIEDERQYRDLSRGFPECLPTDQSKRIATEMGLRSKARISALASSRLEANSLCREVNEISLPHLNMIEGLSYYRDLAIYCYSQPPIERFSGNYVWVNRKTLWVMHEMPRFGEGRGMRPNTLMESLERHNSHLVTLASLTDLEEHPRCQRFWVNHVQSDDQILQTSTSGGVDQSLIKRTFRQNNTTRTQLHLNGWQDKHSDPDFDLLIRLFQEIEILENQENSGPMHMHCAAGSNRTGAIAVLYEIYKQYKADRNSEIDLVAVIVEMRLMRQHLLHRETACQWLVDFIPRICQYVDQHLR